MTNKFSLQAEHISDVNKLLAEILKLDKNCKSYSEETPFSRQVSVRLKTILSRTHLELILMRHPNPQLMLKTLEETPNSIDFIMED